MDQALGNADPMGEIIRRALKEIEALKCRVESVEEEQHPERILRALDTVWDKLPEKPLLVQFDEMSGDTWHPAPAENVTGDGI